STARTLYVRGARAARGAVEEVQKRAQEIRDTQTPAVPPRARASYTSLERRLVALERRERRLAGLLGVAVGGLWEVQGKLA
ncbi:hypothetical protein LTR53_018712, partial [Teratosphaeriaceae sp. CCFEE 6253]